MKKKREGTPQIAITVGHAIARQRKRTGKTQSQVAEEMETGIETISRLESGAILQTVDSLQQLAKVLHCPVTSFFWQDGGDEHVQSDTIADMIRILPQEKRAVVVNLVADMVRALI